MTILKYLNRSYFPPQISNSNQVWVEIPNQETVSGQWYRAALPNRLGQLINCFNNCLSLFPLVSCPKPKNDCTREIFSLLALWGSCHLQHWELFGEGDQLKEISCYRIPVYSTCITLLHQDAIKAMVFERAKQWKCDGVWVWMVAIESIFLYPSWKW